MAPLAARVRYLLPQTPAGRQLFASNRAHRLFDCVLDTLHGATANPNQGSNLTHQSVIKTTFLLYMTASGAISAG